MESLEFLVQGSAEEPYRITFSRRSPGNLSGYCTCPAGENGQYCKHRFRIMNGDREGLVSPNWRDVATIGQWLSGSDVERAMSSVLAAEVELDAAKKGLSAAKKALARSLRD